MLLLLDSFRVDGKNCGRVVPRAVCKSAVWVLKTKETRRRSEVRRKACWKRGDRVVSAWKLRLGGGEFESSTCALMMCLQTLTVPFFTQVSKRQPENY